MDATNRAILAVGVCALGLEEESKTTHKEEEEKEDVDTKTVTLERKQLVFLDTVLSTCLLFVDITLFLISIIGIP